MITPSDVSWLAEGFERGEGDSEGGVTVRSEVSRLMTALDFAARAHANQRRKGAAQEPYVNHLIEVGNLIAAATGGEDTDLVIGGLLHDTLEDTKVTFEQLSRRFGDRIAGWVAENTDDMSLPKEERKRRRLELARAKSPGAKTIKLADMISNLRATALSPPAGWPAEWCLGYIKSCREMHEALAGANAQLDRLFADEADRAEASVKQHFARLSDGGSVAFQLDATAGQRVHLIYLANTEIDRTPLDRDRLAAVMETSFPSFVMQDAEGVFEGVRRPVLTMRVRTDSTDAIVAMAQRLCVEFDQRFVGIETEGRYLRVYADDTG